jgi:hypothetical protein
MPKIKIISYFMLALITLAFASCAAHPQATTSNQAHSPLDRNNGNGLASLNH